VVPDHNNSCFASNYFWHHEQRTVLMYLVTALASSPQTGNTRKGFEILHWHHSLCLSIYLSIYLMSSHVTKSPRPSPFVLAYCKRSKTGGGNSLGMRLTICAVLRATSEVTACDCPETAWNCVTTILNCRWWQKSAMTA